MTFSRLVMMGLVAVVLATGCKQKDPQPIPAPKASRAHLGSIDTPQPMTPS